MTDLSGATRFWLYLLLGPMLLYALWTSLAGAQQRKCLLERQAARRGGKFLKGSWLEWPRLRLACQGEEVDILLTPRNRYRPAQTRAEFKPQGILLSECRLVDNRRLKRRDAQMRRIATQDEAFDARYSLLAADDPLMVFRLAQTPTRERLLAFDFPWLEIQTHPDGFEMSMAHIPLNDEDLDDFIETVLLVVRMLVLESPRKQQPVLE